MVVERARLLVGWYLAWHLVDVHCADARKLLCGFGLDCFDLVRNSERSVELVRFRWTVALLSLLGRSS